MQEQIDTYNGFNFVGTIFALTMLYSVICRALFNALSEIKAVWDKWTILDGITSVVCVFCFTITGTITPQDIMDETRKQTFDYYVVVVLIMAWIRFFAFFLVIKSISRILMTLIQMLIDTISFGIILVCYLLLMATVFTTLFQGPAQDEYGSLSISLRTLFDVLLANYDDVTLSSRGDLHTYLRMFHLVIANIFLLNYLIAILSSAYEYMNEVGEFDYKANKYQFSEKYQSVLACKKGFGELCAIPAPFNMFNIFILPFTLVPDSFLGYAEIYSKLMFWLDNIVLCALFFAYLWVLVPFIFFKVLYNFFRTTNIFSFIPLALLWIALGFLFLPIYVFRDIAYLFMILCSYGDADDITKEKLIEEVTQDRIVVFNEVMDVMNAIKLLFQSKSQKKHKKSMYRSQTLFGKSFRNADEENELDEKILINKELIVKSWVKYRPNDSFNDNREEDTTAGTNSNKNFLTVVDESFIKKIMDNVYQNNDNIDFDDEGSDVSSSKGGFEDRSDVPEVELKMINDFLVRFLITSISHQKDKLDLILALRALPKHINEHNVHKINLINFGAIRQSLNALRNDDNRTMKRFLNLWSKSKENTDEVNTLKDIAFRMIYKIGKVLDIDPDFILDPTGDNDKIKPLDSVSDFN